MSLDPDICWRATVARDARFDGRFFIGVQTTGIYCRPVCPARTPKRKNIDFYSCAAAAEDAGLRPCKRCRPETAPGSSAWLGTSATIKRALRLIDGGALESGNLESLVDSLGIGERQLRRLFLREIGTTPAALARTRRLHFARKLLVETKLGIAEVAFHAGFSSLRGFNDAMRSAYNTTPSSLRRGASETKSSEIRLRLNYRPPFDWAGTLEFLGPRLLGGVEAIIDGHWRRSATIDGKSFLIDVCPDPKHQALITTIEGPPPGSLAQLVRRIRRVFDLDADLEAVASALGSDPILKASVAKRPGLRVPGAWDLYEILVRAVLGQQVSVAAATTVTTRVIQRFGTQPPGLGGFYTFPLPDVLAEAPLESCGINRGRAEAVRTVSRAVLNGIIDLETAKDPEEFEALLVALPGIGPWTARYVCMRGLGEPDAFPDSDLGLLRAMEAAGQVASPKTLALRAEAWRPWRAYAALHLWAGLGEAKQARKVEKTKAGAAARSPKRPSRAKGQATVQPRKRKLA